MNKLINSIDNWYDSINSTGLISNITDNDINRALSPNSHFSLNNLQALLSPKASNYLETMAQKAKSLREQHFGNTIKLFTPIYISNYCQNGCKYCAFKQDNRISRTQLDQNQLTKECEKIASSGLRHILVLTGEAPKITSFEYLKESLKTVSNHFSSISIEVYPLEIDQYKKLVEEANLDGLTLYQETYNRDVYKEYHPYGKKRDYNWRIAGIDRGIKGGVRSVTIGALLGLDNPIAELGSVAIHLNYIQKKYPQVELTVSFPRLRDIVGSTFEVNYPIDDKFYAQVILAFRILFPHIGITLSTRESVEMRNGLIPLGITKISAGVSTSVGSESSDMPSDEQFEIADERSVKDIKNWLTDNNFQPIFHDWNSRLTAK